jgi:hypothetical protein
MALQDGDLVAQDQDLGGLPRIRTPGQPQPPEHLRDQEEDEPQAHDRWSSRPGCRYRNFAAHSLGRDFRHPQGLSRITPHNGAVTIVERCR